MLTNGMVALLSVYSARKNGGTRYHAGPRGTRRAALVGCPRRPRRRDETPLAIARELHRGVARLELPVPELARDPLVALVEPLAVVRELAATDLVAHAETDLPEPVGVG